MKNLKYLVLVGMISLAGCNLLKPGVDESQVLNNWGPGSEDSGGSLADAGGEVVTSDRYVEYSEDAVAAAMAADGNVVLFFHATWCPTCRAADGEMTSNLDKIPENLTIVKTDYDKYDELKKKYGVTYQHTFVQIDARGEMVKKWNGGGLDQIVEEVQG